MDDLFAPLFGSEQPTAQASGRSAGPGPFDPNRSKYDDK
jgi:hypothetical protein